MFTPTKLQSLCQTILTTMAITEFFEMCDLIPKKIPKVNWTHFCKGKIKMTDKQEKEDITKNPLFYPQPTKIQLERQMIIKQWMNDNLSLHQAAIQLMATGIDTETAWSTLQDN